MKKSSIVHCFYILFPAVILLGIYYFLTGSGFSVLWNFNSEKIPADAPLNGHSDPFEQTASFTDAEVSESISLYESTLSGISSRYGASVLVKPEKVADPIEPHSATAPQILGAPTGDLAESENKEGGKSEASELVSPPTAWNPSEADIWQIDSCWASHTNPANDQFRRLAFTRRTSSGWEKADAEAFFADSDSSQTTIFYIHGNRTERNTALMQGMQVLQHFPGAVPARLVLWNWDAERVSHRPRIEYSTKAGYADFQGFYLAEILSRMAENSHVLLVGHSFGCRTVLSSLHLLAGGTVGTRTLVEVFPTENLDAMIPTPINIRFGENVKGKEESKETPVPENQNVELAGIKHPKLDALLVASAVSCTVLNPGGMYDRALETVSEMHVTRNGADPALKFYPLMKGARTRLPEAMGFVGPVLNHVNEENAAKVHVIRLEYQTHQFLEYISMRCVQNGLQFGENQE